MHLEYLETKRKEFLADLETNEWSFCGDLNILRNRVDIRRGGTGQKLELSETGREDGIYIYFDCTFPEAAGNWITSKNFNQFAAYIILRSIDENKGLAIYTDVNPIYNFFNGLSYKLHRNPGRIEKLYFKFSLTPDGQLQNKITHKVHA